MTVTEIIKEKKHLNRVVFDDGGELILDREVSDLNLYVEKELSQDDLEQLKYESDYARARSRAVWYLDRMAYTEKGLYTKLLKAGFDKKASAAVIARFREAGLLDDRKFAENLADRLINQNVSKREAVFKMTEKGVPRDIAKEILDRTDTDETAQIRALIEKKYHSKLLAENGTQKVYAALIRKGFSFSVVREVLKNYCEELEYCEEE